MIHKEETAERPLPYYDCHNHLHDARFDGVREAVLVECRKRGLRRMVVNGTHEDDWQDVLQLAQSTPEIIPSFGYHPWYIHTASENWDLNLLRALETIPSCVGEIGLDRWKEGLDFDRQLIFFRRQMEIAHERDLVASIHCLKAWGPLLAELKSGPKLKAGFLLHSFGGTVELIPELVRLGAYFSMPSYFLGDQRVQKREVFRSIPHDRILVESDAPDQSPSAHYNLFPLRSVSNELINHPCNVIPTTHALSQLLGMGEAACAALIEQNFKRLFGRFMNRECY